MSEHIIHMQTALITAVEPTVQVEGQNIAQEAMQFLSENPTFSRIAAVGIGVAVGAALEYRGLSRIERSRDAIVGALGDVTEPIKPKGLRKTSGKVTRSIMSLAAAGGGLVGAANALTWINTGADQVVPASIEFVADKSGVTVLGAGEPATQIQLIAANLDTLDGVSIIARSAVADRVDSTNVEDSVNLVPFGESKVGDAIKISVDEIAKNRASLTAGQEIRNSAILVATNGEADLSPQLEEQLLGTGAPLFVFDVDPSSQIAVEMQDLVAATNGEYFDASSMSSADVQGALQLIQAELNSVEKPGHNRPNWSFRTIVAGLSLAALTSWRSGRSRLSTNFQVGGRRSIKEIRKDKKDIRQLRRAERSNRKQPNNLLNNDRGEI